MNEPDWADSKTGDSEIWKNPLIPMNDRLEIADGAIRFRDEQLDRLRAENATLSESVTSQALLIASLKEERRKDSADMLLMIGDIRYVAGIAERGRGIPLGDGEKFTQAVLDYVKSLESQLSDTQRQNAELMQRVGEAEKDAERYNWARQNIDANNFSPCAEEDFAEGYPEYIDSEIDAAIAASKVSNEVAYKGDESPKP